MAMRSLTITPVQIIYAMWLKHEPCDASLFMAGRGAHALFNA